MINRSNLLSKTSTRNLKQNTRIATDAFITYFSGCTRAFFTSIYRLPAATMMAISATTTTTTATTTIRMHRFRFPSSLCTGGNDDGGGFSLCPSDSKLKLTAASMDGLLVDELSGVDDDDVEDDCLSPFLYRPSLASVCADDDMWRYR